MPRKSEMSLIKVSINKNIKDKLLNQLSTIHEVQIKSKEDQETKQKLEEKDPTTKTIKDLRQNLISLFKKLNISESDFQALRLKKLQKLDFVVNDLYELINIASDEIDFYLNRLNELDRYVAKATVELENLMTIKSSYVFLEQYQLNRESLAGLNKLNFKIFITYTKNLDNLKLLFDFSSFPNIYQTDESYPNKYQLEDRVVFYIIYPVSKEQELNERINLIHAEEVPILKKYLKPEGIDFSRINNEINIIETTLSKYEKEKEKLREQNLLKLAALDEIVKNIEEFNWAEHQFEEISPERVLLRFFVPTEDKDSVEKMLLESFKDRILLEIIDVPRFKETREAKGREGTLTDISRYNQIQLKETPNDKKKSSRNNKEKDLRKEVPRVMRNPFFIRPFETLTRMYGTPAYSEIDPTPFLAVTFPLIFGLMFGDIGHGFVLVVSGLIGGIFLRKRGRTFRDLSWIIFYCGIGAMFFGYLYGEFFGSNNLLGIPLNPFSIPVPLIGVVTFHDPLNNILSIFLFTLLIGVIHVSLGWFIQFLNYWRQDKKYLAFTDSFVKICLLIGGSLLIFHYGIDLTAWLRYPYPILLVIIPGILLIILKPIGGLVGISYLKEESFSSLLGEGSIETFETGLSILSNIASYIRLLALALTHVALMISITAMINLLPEPAPIIEGMDVLQIVGIIGIEILRVIGIILGNIIVILLEGVLVFINAIRLHFYEFFFKFYQGTGIGFFPFTLNENYSRIIFRIDIRKDIVSEEIQKEIEAKKVKEDLQNAITYIEDKFL